MQINALKYSLSELLAGMQISTDTEAGCSFENLQGLKFLLN